MHLKSRQDVGCPSASLMLPASAPHPRAQPRPVQNTPPPPMLAGPPVAGELFQVELQYLLCFGLWLSSQPGPGPRGGRPPYPGPCACTPPPHTHWRPGIQVGGGRRARGLRALPRRLQSAAERAPLPLPSWSLQPDREGRRRRCLHGHLGFKKFCVHIRQRVHKSSCLLLKAFSPLSLWKYFKAHPI